MQDRDTLKRHAALVDQMVSALGGDLEEAALAGRVTIDEISDAVLRCTGCRNPGRCASLVAARVEGAPEYCQNRDLMARLRQGAA